MSNPAIDFSRELKAKASPADVWEAFSATLGNLQSLPAIDQLGSLRVSRLTAHGWPHAEFPASWQVKRHLDLSNSPALEHLPAGLEVEVLVLRNCTGLRALPEGLRVSFLDLTG